MEWYAFVHFGLNTYTGKEWGYGDESPDLFNPSSFDAKKIVKAFRQAGMRGMIYTAKHHDGFCAWPTRSTNHNITRSPWKKGKGDVVKEFAKACKEQGIKFGTYLSPWDRNCAEYGKPGYLRTYYKQIEELLTKYGPIFEIWFDGANGGDGYYGGAREKRNIGNADTYYDYERVVKLIRRLQPDCIIWGAASRGDVTWGGSEQGHVKYPCWSVINLNKPNERWLALEGDTTINRAGWFWHPGQENKVKSPELLMQKYFESVGRGANLILNVAPDRTGNLDPADVAVLLQFGENRRRLLSKDYALGAAATASEVRGNDPQFGADKVTDGDIESYWCPNDGTKTGELELRLDKPATFDVVRVREQIRLGQRVESFQIDAWVDGAWKTVDDGGLTIGNQVLRLLPAPVTSDRVRVRITAARACPCINEVSLLKMPGQMPAPSISRKGNNLEISALDGYTVHYTTDGSEPTEKSPVFHGATAVALNGAAIVKAVYIDDKNGSCGPITAASFGISKEGWKTQTPGAEAAFDDKPDTHWEAEGSPAEIVVDMGQNVKVGAFSYLPRQDGKLLNMTDRYSFLMSRNGKQWLKLAEGEFSNLKANPIELTVELSKPCSARYFKFKSTRSIEGTGGSAAELNIFPARNKNKADAKK